MEAIKDFLANNYMIFMIISVVLLIALIGFLVGGKKKKKDAGEVPANNGVQPDAQNTAMPTDSNMNVAPVSPVGPTSPWIP